MTAARVLLSAIALAGLSACLSVTGDDGFQCFTKAPVVSSTRGDTTITEIGLKYRDTQPGTGTEAPACELVTAHYRARVLGGAPFDSSYGRQPLTYVAGGGQLRVVGVDVGVIGMRVGGKRELIIPANLAYGDTEQRDQNGNVVIPAGSTLVFEMELVSVDIRD